MPLITTPFAEHAQGAAVHLLVRAAGRPNHHQPPGGAASAGALGAPIGRLKRSSAHPRHAVLRAPLTHDILSLILHPSSSFLILSPFRSAAQAAAGLNPGQVQLRRVAGSCCGTHRWALTWQPAAAGLAPPPSQPPASPACSQYWTLDYSERCFEGRHLALSLGLGALGLLLLAVGWPLGVGLWLYDRWASRGQCDKGSSRSLIAVSDKAA
jgi:hypothetical protein